MHSTRLGATFLLAQRPPNLERAVLCRQRKIIVGCQHRQLVPDAKLRQQRVNCTELDTGTLTQIAQSRRIDVVTPIRNDQR